jgi:ribosomal protein S18 acetylase RimI-like enzyme
MEMESGALEIVPAGPEHDSFILGLAASAFSRFGDYRTFLGQTMRLPWIATFVALVDDRPVAFAMISLEDVSRGEVDLTAIAVEPGWRSRGVGRCLLRHVEATAEELAPAGREASVRLSVAEDNVRARRLFVGAGFAVVPGGEGEYPAGQSSLTLRKSIRAAGLTPGGGGRTLDR